MAVTGAKGRLGRALTRALAELDVRVLEWSRPDYDLDEPESAERAFERDRPDLVIHAAAWTDVDGCALQPDLALRRNAEAVAELAAACTRNRSGLIFVSTNEVFDGERTDGLGYTESDAPNPINPYGVSKLAGEVNARAVFEGEGAAEDLLIVRTSWLFGPPGADFPSKIIGAADRLPASEPVRVVSDEIGSPTYSVDLADGIMRLAAGESAQGTYHLTNEGAASRLEIARRVLGHCRPQRVLTAISRSEFPRPSCAPAWAVLENGRARAAGANLRPWTEAVDAYVPSLCVA